MPQFVRDDRLMLTGEEVAAVAHHSAIDRIREDLANVGLAPFRALRGTNAVVVQFASDRRLRYSLGISPVHAKNDSGFASDDLDLARRFAANDAGDVSVPVWARPAVAPTAFGSGATAAPYVLALRLAVSMRAHAIERREHKTHLTTYVLCDRLDPIARLGRLEHVLDQVRAAATVTASEPVGAKDEENDVAPACHKLGGTCTG